MAEQGNCAPVTPAAKKRAAPATATAELQAPNKKRVVLGELTNLSNVVVQKPELQRDKGRINKKVRKPIPTVSGSTVKPEHVDARVNDPQFCARYVSDIYEYLREMEVSKLLYQIMGF